MTMRSIGVMQEFTRGDKRQARATRFEREAEAAEAGRAVALASLQRDTAAAWLDRHYQERVRAILVAQRDEAGLQIELPTPPTEGAEARRPMRSPRVRPSHRSMTASDKPTGRSRRPKRSLRAGS